MKFKYDSQTDAIYIKFAKGKYDHSRKVSENILVDEDKKGRVLGMEILDATETIPDFDIKKKNLQFKVA